MLSVGRGASAPLGATVQADGVNFSVFSKNATLMELLLFDNADSIVPVRIIRLDAKNHRTYHYWHAFIPGLKPGQVYGFKATGPFEPERGLRFDSNRVLLDPYGPAITIPKEYRRDNPAIAMKSIIADPSSYDWEGDQPLRRPFVETVIYELHVRGFTRHPSSGVAPERLAPMQGLYRRFHTWSISGSLRLS